MKNLLLSVVAFLISLPLCAAELSEHRDYKEYSLFLDEGEAVTLTATSGIYTDYWNRSEIYIRKVKETYADILYVVDQNPLYHPMIVPDPSQLREREDKASIIIRQGTKESYRAIIRILAPNSLFLKLSHPKAEKK